MAGRRMNHLDDLIDDGLFVLPLRLRRSQNTGRLVILLHGVGGNEGNLAGLPARLPEDTAVALVRAPITLGPGQYAWFRVSFTAEGPRIVEAEAEHSRQLLIELVTQLRDHLGLTASDVTIAGFSQGGIMSASVALTSPETARAFAVLSGRILPELTPLLASQDDLAATRGFIGHGRQDQKLPVSWADAADTLLNSLRVNHETHLYAMGHELGPEMVADFLAWLR
jgi:phospholipase/carboxylesterase